MTRQIRTEAFRQHVTTIFRRPSDRDLHARRRVAAVAVGVLVEVLLVVVLGDGPCSRGGSPSCSAANSNGRRAEARRPLRWFLGEVKTRQPNRPEGEKSCLLQHTSFARLRGSTSHRGTDSEVGPLIQYGVSESQLRDAVQDLIWLVAIVTRRPRWSAKSTTPSASATSRAARSLGESSRARPTSKRS